MSDWLEEQHRIAEDEARPIRICPECKRRTRLPFYRGDFGGGIKCADCYEGDYDVYDPEDEE